MHDCTLNQFYPPSLAHGYLVLILAKPSGFTAELEKENKDYVKPYHNYTLSLNYSRIATSSLLGTFYALSKKDTSLQGCKVQNKIYWEREIRNIITCFLQKQNYSAVHFSFGRKFLTQLSLKSQSKKQGHSPTTSQLNTSPVLHFPQLE